jgi:formaldehyde-activating enzyme involved in methanogenesis
MKRTSRAFNCTLRSALLRTVCPQQFQRLFDVDREATSKVIGKAMRNEPTVGWLLANQDEVQHYLHELGMKGEL